MNAITIPLPSLRPLIGTMLIALILTGWFAPVQASSLYRPPDMEKEIFKPKKVELDKFDRAGLVAALISTARDFDEENNEVDYELRAHALAIAGRLDDDSDKFKDTCAQLADNGKTIGEDDVDPARVASRIYSGARSLERESDNKDNQACAAYCVDIALRLDPEGKRVERLEELRDKIKENGATADWDGTLKGAIQPKNGPGGNWWGGSRASYEEREETMSGGKADKFPRKQSAVFGLVVVTLGNGKHAGAASSIIASALRDEDSDKIKFQLNQKCGPMMANSLESIVNFLKVKYEDEPSKVPNGYRIDIVFEDKDQPIDGPSAGTAMALMLNSLFSGGEIDESFACTGGITPNGKVTKIGGVAAKIRGATHRKCKIVGVPEGNSGGVADIVVLDGIEKLLDIQVFSMKDFEEAQAISRADKSSDVNETLEAFELVAKTIREKGMDIVKVAAVQEKLEGVIEKMPNHLSAKLLLDHARGNAPERLSVGGSFQQIDSNASGVFSATQMMAARGKYDHSDTVVETAEEAIKELKSLDSKVDKRLDEYLEGTLKLCKLIEEGRGDDDEEDFIKDLKKTWKSVQQTRKKLMDDPELREEIMG
jgi:hypothetical protein